MMTPRRSVTAKRVLRLALSNPAGVAAVMSAVANARKGGKRSSRASGGVDGFYTQTNTPENAVVVFTRNTDGTIVHRETVKTGGKGLASVPPLGFSILDSSGSVNLTPDGGLLFVVNAGDNTISSFQVTESGLKLADRVPSGGILPVSLTSSGDLLYVLNELSGSIFGLRFSDGGQLTPIVNSLKALSAVGPSGAPGQIGFAPGGNVLVVTQRDLGVIDTFRLAADGSPGPAQPHTGNAPQPFGFAFAGPHLEVTNAGPVATPRDAADPAQLNGSVSSYDVVDPGALTATGNIASGGRATCWIAVTNDNRYAFVTNSLSGTVPDVATGRGAISRFSVASDGTLTLLGQTETGPGFPSDLALSSDSQYLYVLDPTLKGDDTSHVDVFRVGSDGSLTHVQSTTRDLPRGISGAAAF
jgi:6-phosphogluconolactonase (cycloisomerase 2 family)